MKLLLSPEIVRNVFALQNLGNYASREGGFWVTCVNPGTFGPVHVSILGEEQIIKSRSGIQIRYKVELSRNEG